MDVIYNLLDFDGNIIVLTLVLIAVAAGLSLFIGFSLRDPEGRPERRWLASAAALLPWILAGITEWNKYSTAKTSGRGIGYIAWLQTDSSILKGLLIAGPVLLFGGLLAATIFCVSGSAAKWRAIYSVLLTWAGVIWANVNIAGHYDWRKMEGIFIYYCASVLVFGIIGTAIEGEV
jgi:hypothetical protein